MSFSSLSIVLGGNGVVSPASLFEMSSVVDADESKEMSDDLLLLILLSPFEPSKIFIMFMGGGWVKK